MNRKYPAGMGACELGKAAHLLVMLGIELEVLLDKPERCSRPND